MNEYPSMKEQSAQLKKNVDEDWSYWNSLSGDADKINHFTQQVLLLFNIHIVVIIIIIIIFIYATVLCYHAGQYVFWPGFFTFLFV